MWQKARCNGDGGIRRGRELWVIARPPTHEDIYDVHGVTDEDQICHETNIIRDGQPAMVGIEVVELLPEFADTVPLVDFETWRKEQQV